MDEKDNDIVIDDEVAEEDRPDNEKQAVIPDVEMYRDIIEQQRKMIDSSNARIDELTKQIGNIINNGGNFNEKPKVDYKPVDFGIETLSESFESMDFTI